MRLKFADKTFILYMYPERGEEKIKIKFSRRFFYGFSYRTGNA